MSDSVRPHRWQPTRALCLWDSSDKNPAVGCHFLLQCIEVKSESEFAQSCPPLSDPIDCSLPGSSGHEIFQARVLEWVSIAFSDKVEGDIHIFLLVTCGSLTSPIHLINGSNHIDISQVYPCRIFSLRG